MAKIVSITAGNKKPVRGGKRPEIIVVDDFGEGIKMTLEQVEALQKNYLKWFDYYFKDVTPSEYMMQAAAQIEVNSKVITGIKPMKYTSRNNALARYHMLLKNIGISDDEKEALLSSFGVESAAKLPTHEIVELCEKLQQKSAKKRPLYDKAGDKWRKMVIAAIDSWLGRQYSEKLKGKAQNIGYIKGIAVNASGIHIVSTGRSKQVAINKAFNTIDIEKLKAIYNEFKNKK